MNASPPTPRPAARGHYSQAIVHAGWCTWQDNCPSCRPNPIAKPGFEARPSSDRERARDPRGRGQLGQPHPQGHRVHHRCRALAVIQRDLRAASRAHRPRAPSCRWRSCTTSTWWRWTSWPRSEIPEALGDLRLGGEWFPAFAGTASVERPAAASTSTPLFSPRAPQRDPESWSTRRRSARRSHRDRAPGPRRDDAELDAAVVGRIDTPFRCRPTAAPRIELGDALAGEVERVLGPGTLVITAVAFFAEDLRDCSWTTFGP